MCSRARRERIISSIQTTPRNAWGLFVEGDRSERYFRGRNPAITVVSMSFRSQTKALQFNISGLYCLQLPRVIVLLPPGRVHVCGGLVSRRGALNGFAAVVIGAEAGLDLWHKMADKLRHDGHAAANYSTGNLGISLQKEFLASEANENHETGKHWRPKSNRNEYVCQIVFSDYPKAVDGSENTSSAGTMSS